MTARGLVVWDIPRVWQGSEQKQEKLSEGKMSHKISVLRDVVYVQIFRIRRTPMQEAVSLLVTETSLQRLGGKPPADQTYLQRQ